MQGESITSTQTYLVGEYAGLRMKRDDSSLVSTHVICINNQITPMRYLVGLYAGLRKKKREN